MSTEENNISESELPDSLQPIEQEKIKPKRVRPERVRVCQAVGVGEIACSEKRLCKAHVITRKYNSIRAADENILWLCKDHEAWFNQRDIRVWFTWVRINFPEKFKFVEREFEFIIEEYNEFLSVAYSRPKGDISILTNTEDPSTLQE